MDVAPFRADVQPLALEGQVAEGDPAESRGDQRRRKESKHGRGAKRVREKSLILLASGEKVKPER